MRQICEYYLGLFPSRKFKNTYKKNVVEDLQTFQIVLFKVGLPTLSL